MKKKTVVDLIRAYYEDDANLFFNSTLDVVREFKENGDKELYEHLMNILRGRVKVRPKIEKTSTCDMEISFEDAEKLGFIGPYLVPQSEATPEIDSAVLDRVALEERIKTDCPYPLHTACPRSARYAYLDDDEIVIVFHAFGNQEKVFSTVRFKIADKDKTWGFLD